MINTFKTENSISAGKTWQLLMASTLVLLLTGCGGVDSGDGEVVSNVALPTDSALTLHCPNAGIGAEPCILDDPDNPYAITPVLAGDPEEEEDENGDRPPLKWRLASEAGSAKARFYLWATVQAMEPTGEHQYFTARALHELYGESGSELTRDHALKAYRSVLDNYFYSATFFSASDFNLGSTDIFSVPVRNLVGESVVFGAEFNDVDVHLFDDAGDEVDAITKALDELGKWGYSHNGTSGEVTSNN